MTRTQQILLVDDDAALRKALGTCLEAVGYQWTEAQDSSVAKDWLKEGHPVDLIVTDHQMPWVNGMELIQGLKGQVPTESTSIFFNIGNIVL